MEDKLILVGIFQKFDTVNRNPSRPYTTRGFWPKNLTRMDKINRIYETREI